MRKNQPWKAETLSVSILFSGMIKMVIPVKVLSKWCLFLSELYVLVWLYCGNLEDVNVSSCFKNTQVVCGGDRGLAGGLYWHKGSLFGVSFKYSM